MKQFLTLLAAALLALTAWAGTRDDFKANPRLSANNYRAYPDRDLPALTPAPAGYEPFYLTHYGRHGSRWLISPEQYGYAVQQLAKADSAGVLTARGKQILDTLRLVEASAHLRLGELSDIGAEQHQGIARRMFQNFPQVFAGNAPVDARSTVVIRCILSMQNETDMLKSLNPALRITTDASQHDMYYMNFDDPLYGQLRQPVRKQVVPQIKARWVHPEHMLQRLFTSQEWARQHIDGQLLMTRLFDLLSNMQSHHQWERVNFYDLFTASDIYDLWQYNNASWYLWSGDTPLTQNRAPYIEANLLRNFVTTADSCLLLGRNCATLRFGHESCLLPLVCLMGLDGMDYRTASLDSLAGRWEAWTVFPMAGNVQWVFYRPTSGQGDILVKFLLNEHEARLPQQVKPVSGPYYRWTDARRYFLDKLAAQPQVTLTDSAKQ